MSFTFDAESKGHNNSMSMIEILGIIIFAILLIAPLVSFVGRRCNTRRNRIASTPTIIRNFMLGSVMTQQEMDDRKGYLERHLTTCKVIASDDNGVDGEKIMSSTIEISKVHKGNLMLSPDISNDSKPSDVESDDDDFDSRPMCAICVATYKHGEEICWSNNNQCHHFFHKACIEEWLLLHEDCPCCRLPFLESEEKSIQDGVVDEERI